MLYTARRFTQGATGHHVRNLTIWQAVAYATELGIAFATSVLLGVFVGHVVDDRVSNEAPIFTLLGALLGLAAGVYSTIQLVQVLTRPEKE
ncbi:MAG: putative F0F1-ATPase subunit Ca2+/Mg2+ transporter [Chloroflexota bacterium]|jgi:F0F1-type ATP synthase assembly protein I|nr:putative F0F1-ATPase subunit Ca2+/Mg2+ transporter [Chloroflexota bacterium]